MKAPTASAAREQSERAVDSKPLHQAASLVGGVLSHLNTESDTCGECGRRRDVDFTQAEAARSLKRIIKDLRFYARILGDGIDLIAERRRKQEGQ